jgi:hypothetical protein
MTNLKTMIGICAISALAICAFAAQSASAKGQTAYLCSASATPKQFKDAHCKEKTEVVAEQKFGHTAIPLNTPTPITLTNITTGTETSIARVKSVQSGITLELSATEVHGTGTLENKEEEGEMFAHGTGTITFKGVEVTLPAGKGCKVPGKTVTTKELTGTTKGLTNQLEFRPGPKAEGKFAEFTVEGCEKAELNHVYTATGSVIGNTAGATTTFTHAAVTTQGTFKLFGQKAGLDGTITLKDVTTGEGIALT